MNQIYPCLWFDGQAKAAADFYCSVFDNSRIIVETPMVVNFEINGQAFMGLNGGPMFTINPSISVFVTFETIEETDATWEKLIVGGKALIAIDSYDWSKRYGWLQDQFGLTWQLSVVNNAADNPQTRPAMLFTNQQFGRAEEALRLYTSIFTDANTNTMIHYPDGTVNGGKVLYSEFNIGDHHFIAMDGPGVHDYCFNEGVSLVVSCQTQSEIDHYWNNLIANGGQEGRCGWLKDPFGVSWQIVPSMMSQLMSNPAKGQALMQAMMTMNKMDIETLQNA